MVSTRPWQPGEIVCLAHYQKTSDCTSWELGVDIETGIWKIEKPGQPPVHQAESFGCYRLQYNAVQQAPSPQGQRHSMQHAQNVAATRSNSERDMRSTDMGE